MKLISNGIVPEEGWDEPENPLSHHQAYRVAATRGYRVPRDFYNNPKSNPSEEEAWYALQEMLRGSPFAWKWESPIGHRQVFENVAQVRTQFIVPTLSDKKGPPYVVDQLWIVRAGKNRVRLICLEVDGESHVHESWNKSAERDEELVALGYEVYHVAAWWCRVDSYRVICEFLAESGIYPNANKWLVGSDLRRIDNYVCARCEKPMIRWDENWIQEEDVHGSRVAVHQCCISDRS